MNNHIVPDGKIPVAYDGHQEPQAKEVSPGVNQATGTAPAPLPSGNGSDQESVPGSTVSLSPDQIAKQKREAKAARKWAAVLALPCTSGACSNVIGQPCTFADGRVRQKPHDQRISAAEKAGAYVQGQRVPAVAVQG